MKATGRFFILGVFAVLMLVEVGCRRQSSALPLSLAAVRQLSPTNTARISFRRRSLVVRALEDGRLTSARIWTLFCP